MQLRTKGRLVTGAFNNIEVRGQRPRKKKYERPGKVIYLDPKLFNQPEKGKQ